jgi:hypothetical protein
MTRCESGFVPLRVQNDRAVIRFLHHLRTPINSFNRSYGILTLAQRMFVVRFAQYQHAAARAAPAVRARGVVVGGVVGGWCALAYATLQRYGLADTQWSCAPVSIRAAQWMERVVAPRMDRVVMEEWRRELINAAHYGSVSAVYYLGGINREMNFGDQIAAGYLLRSGSGSRYSQWARKARLQLRTSCAPLQALVDRHVQRAGSGRSSSATCRCCDSGMDEDQGHALCECSLHEEDRAILFAAVDRVWLRAALRQRQWWRAACVAFHARHGLWSELNARQQSQWLLSTGDDEDDDDDVDGDGDADAGGGGHRRGTRGGLRSIARLVDWFLVRFFVRRDHHFRHAPGRPLLQRRGVGNGGNGNSNSNAAGTGDAA